MFLAYKFTIYAELCRERDTLIGTGNKENVWINYISCVVLLFLAFYLPAMATEFPDPVQIPYVGCVLLAFGIVRLVDKHDQRIT